MAIGIQLTLNRGWNKGINDSSGFGKDRVLSESQTLNNTVDLRGHAQFIMRIDN